MRVALFITCLVDQFYPQVGEAMVRILNSQGITVDLPPAQTCCGQPAYNSGYVEEARVAALTLLESFENADAVVSPSGSCTGMVHHYYPKLFAGTRDESRAKALGEKTFEFSSFLLQKLRIKEMNAVFPHTVTYHPSCHATRLLGVRDEPLELLQMVRGLHYKELDLAQDCCGFGGAFALKMANLSSAMVEEKVRHVTATQADILVGTDMGCLMNIGGRLRHEKKTMRVMHVAELLWEAMQQAQVEKAVNP